MPVRNARDTTTTWGPQGMDLTTQVENQNPETAVAESMHREEEAKDRVEMHGVTTRLFCEGYMDNPWAKREHLEQCVLFRERRGTTRAR